MHTVYPCCKHCARFDDGSCRWKALSSTPVEHHTPCGHQGCPGNTAEMKE